MNADTSDNGPSGRDSAPANDPQLDGSMPRVWYWPPWQLSSPWKVFVFRGADEWERKTLAFHLGPLGCVIVATGVPGSAPVDLEPA